MLNRKKSRNYSNISFEKIIFNIYLTAFLFFFVEDCIIWILINLVILKLVEKDVPAVHLPKLLVVLADVLPANL